MTRRGSDSKNMPSSGGAAESYRVVPSKLSPPSQPTDVVVRRRLIEKLVDSDSPVVLVVAPAGFGKSLLMAQFHAAMKGRDQPVAWLSLDERDNDFGRFIAHFQESIRGLPLLSAESDGSAVARYEHGISDIREEAFAWLDHMAAMESPFCLFLDEFESIRSFEVHAFVADLLRQLKPGQRAIIGARSMQALPLTSLELEGKVMRLEARELSFDLAETLALFSRQKEQMLSDDDIELMQIKTEGWPAALRLVTLTLPTLRDAGAWVVDALGRAGRIAHYLAENVMAHLPERTYRFLVETSILEYLDADLCDALIGSDDSAQILEELALANLFLTLVDLRTHRYELHPLFRSFLQEELKRRYPDKGPLLHRKAATIFFDSARHADAMEHALASQDSVFAVDVLNSCIPICIDFAYYETIARWISALPVEAIRDHARIQRVRAFVAIALLRFAEADDALNRLESIAAKQGKSLDSEAIAQRVLLYEWMDRIDLADKESARIGDLAKLDDPMVRAITLNIKIYHSIVKYDYTLANEYNHTVKTVYRGATGPMWARVWTQCFEGILEVLLGNVRAAFQRFESALGLASGSSKWAPLTYLADAYYGRGELTRAGSLAEEQLQISRYIGPPDVVILNYRTAARVNFLAGKLDRAELLLSELGEIGDVRGAPRIKAAAWLEKSRIALLVGDNESAARYFALGSDSRNWSAHQVGRYYPQELDDLVVASTRMDLVLGSPEMTVGRLEASILETKESGRRLRRVRLQSLLAQAYSKMNQRGRALGLLRDALGEAAGWGLIHIFSDEPWCLRDLLEELVADGHRVDTDYIGKIIAAISLASPSSDEDALSRDSQDILTLRELGILKLVADGMSNKEIARVLGISGNTVQTHLRKIFQKLHTTNRTHAVARAREHRLLR